MIKTLKKAISIFVTAVFVLSLLPGSVLAAGGYNVWPGDSTTINISLPNTGDDTPFARMLNPAATTTVIKNGTVDLSAMPVLEYVKGNNGKLESDEVYKTYDLDARTTIDGNTNGDFYVSGLNTNRKDRVMEFSFSYEQHGYNPVNPQHANEILVESYFDCYNNYGLTNRLRPNYQMVIKKDCFRFAPSQTGEITSNTVEAGYEPYNFEPNKWYTITLVFDMENKTVETDANAASYTHKAYVNGEFVTSYTTSTALYGVRYLRIMPPVGSIMYWDNINYYEIDESATSTFTPKDNAANLSSADETVIVDEEKINLTDAELTVADVKAAVSDSLKTNEVIRVYNSDLTQELEADSAAIGAKLVVAGSRTFNTTSTKENDLAQRETIYTYYDIGIDGGYIFDEPTISFDGTKAVGNVKVYNYSGEEKQFKVFLGVYSNNELVGLDISDTNLVAADQSAEEFTTPEADLTNADKVKLFVWNADGITPEIECVEKSYTIPDEYNPKNADLKSITMPTGDYTNSEYKVISTLFPAFDKDITEYKVISYVESYSGLTPEFETVNSDANITFKTIPDTSTAVCTVTSADGTVTKDYTFNYVISNNSAKRLYISNIVNVYTKSGGSCLVGWNSKTFNTTTGSSANSYLQDGYFTHNGTKKTIKSSDSILEIDISEGPEKITDGFLRLALTSTFSQAVSDGTLKVCKINDAIYTLDDIFTISTSDVATYFGDELYTLNVSEKQGSSGDMYFVNIGADYYNSLKAAKKDKMYIGLSASVNDPDSGFTAVFAGSGNRGTSSYNISCFDYLSE